MSEEHRPLENSGDRSEELDADLDDPLQHRPHTFGQQRLPLILAIVGLLIVVVYFVWLAPSAGDRTDRRSIEELEMRVEQLEQQLAQTGDLAERLTQIENAARQFEVAVTRLDRFETSTTNRLEVLTRELKSLSSKQAGPSGAVKQKPSESASPSDSASARSHTVKAGETLFQISRQYGLDVNSLKNANNLTDSAVIYPGQKLLIPPKTAP
jgi:LysM repeat protein